MESLAKIVYGGNNCFLNTNLSRPMNIFDKVLIINFLLSYVFSMLKGIGYRGDENQGIRDLKI